MKRKSTTIIVGLFLLIMAAVPAVANAALPDRSEKDLSSLPAIEAYLASIGVGMESVVVQQGPLNYAGPLCPGDGWNCTAANAVVQISTATSGANIFDCLPAVNATFPALNECLVVQSSVLNLADPPPDNSATCTPTFSGDGTTKSKCTMRQTSKKGNNYATVSGRMTQSGGSSQSATQDGTITQMSDGGNNFAKITLTIEQTMNIGTSNDPTQTQKAFQTANVNQTAGSGSNSSDVRLAMLQMESATSTANITQEQNKDSASPNQDASITQMSTSGNNTSYLSHQITQRQDGDNKACGACTLSQTQSSTLGGQRGKVDQSTALNSALFNKSVASQVENQTQEAEAAALPPPTQDQFGPQDCCATQTGGGPNNVNTVTLSNTQKQTTEDLQTTDQRGHCMAGAGQECSVDITYTSNSGTHHASLSGPAVTCTGNVETSTCFVPSE